VRVSVLDALSVVVHRPRDGKRLRVVRRHETWPNHRDVWLDELRPTADCRYRDDSWDETDDSRPKAGTHWDGWWKASADSRMADSASVERTVGWSAD
jgi:hypothetical protein